MQITALTLDIQALDPEQHPAQNHLCLLQKHLCR
jgi:hypothetical protein